MPGVVGIISKGPRGKNENDLGLMIDSLMHESFYTKGSYINDQLGIYVGWTCHRSSYSDCMPVVNQKKDVVLIFSGEHFADQSVTSSLGRHGYESDPTNATSLLPLYEDDNEAFLRRLNGSFCGVLIDLRKSTVVLFNDRYGMHRVYYHEDKDEVLFASEAKSLLKVRPKLRSIDVRSLGELVSCDCVLQNRSLFSEVSLLPGGSAWIWALNTGLKKNAYFNQGDWESLPLLDEENFYCRLEETFLKILPRYFQEKSQVGMSLTGGLDSRMIMACLNPPPGEFPCYTFGGMRDTLDISIARKVAEVCHQTHDVIRLDREFFSEFPRLAEQTIYLTDGSLSICNSHDLYFSRLAREIAPIRVTGTFGSEVVRDHTMFNAATYCQKLFHPDLRMCVQSAVETLGDMKKGHKLSVAVFKEIPWRNCRQLAIEQSQLTVRSPYMDNELVELMYQAPGGVRASNEAQRRMIKHCNSKLSRIRTDMGFASETNPLLSKFLELCYYALFKADYIYIFALPHWLTKVDSLCMSANGGRQILGYQKFEYYRIWFRNEFSNYIKEVLLDRQTASRPYFDKRFLELMVRQHIKGNRNYLPEINKALSIELIHRILIDT